MLWSVEGGELPPPRYWLRATSNKFSLKALCSSLLQVQPQPQKMWVANICFGDISDGNSLGLNFTLTSLPRVVPAPCSRIVLEQFPSSRCYTGTQEALKLWELD